MENEAELSGSEYDSDENLDLDEEDDIMEAMSGDEDMKDVDEEELRNQVGRVHLWVLPSGLPFHIIVILWIAGQRCYLNLSDFLGQNWKGNYVDC